MDIFKDIPYGVEDIITRKIAGAVTIGPLGAFIPVVDAGAIAGIWGTMIYEIAQYHNVRLSAADCTNIITACGAAIMGYLGGSKALCFLLNFIPGLWGFGAMAGNAVFNGYYTYAVGKAFHEMVKDHNVNGKTIREIASILRQLFVPIPSLGQLKEIFNMLKDRLLS